MQLISEEKKKIYTAAMADNLKMLRSKADLTQREMSELIGVSHQTYVNAEKRKQLSWNTYLSLVFLFEKIFSDEPCVLRMMEDMNIYPAEYGGFAAESEGRKPEGGTGETDAWEGERHGRLE